MGCGNSRTAVLWAEKYTQAQRSPWSPMLHLDSDVSVRSRELYLRDIQKRGATCVYGKTVRVPTISNGNTYPPSLDRWWATSFILTGLTAQTHKLLRARDDL